nr:hypothetical protein [Tanacetum cinerariifolium]
MFPHHYFQFTSYNQLESKMSKPDNNYKMQYPVLTGNIPLHPMGEARIANVDLRCVLGCAIDLDVFNLDFSLHALTSVGVSKVANTADESDGSYYAKKSVLEVKENQEKDKIRSKSDKNGKPYNDMQQKIKRLQAQLGDLKGKSNDTSCVSDTLNPLSQKLENENVELEFQVSDQKDTICGTSANTKFAKQSILGKPPKVGDTHALSKPVTSNSIPTPQGSKVVKNDKTSVRTKPITVSQPLIITKKVVNSDSNGLSSTGVDNTKTRRPQPRSNTKNDRVSSASKSSRSKNKEVKVEEHHRKLLLSRKETYVI